MAATDFGDHDADGQSGGHLAYGSCWTWVRAPADLLTSDRTDLMQPRHLEVDGVPIRWLESGDGPPVVLIHGIPTSPALWRHVVPLVGGLGV